jgi:hypothetical protein
MLVGKGAQVPDLVAGVTMAIVGSGQPSCDRASPLGVTDRPGHQGITITNKQVRPGFQGELKGLKLRYQERRTEGSPVKGKGDCFGFKGQRIIGSWELRKLAQGD